MGNKVCSSSSLSPPQSPTSVLDLPSSPTTVVEPLLLFPILSLPDEILFEILSRVDLDALPSIPFVCRRFSNIVKHPNFLPSRLLPTLHVLFFSCNSFLMSSSLPRGSTNWSPSTRLSLPTPHLDASLVSLGRYIYAIGHRDAIRYDTWTKTAVLAAANPEPRVSFAAAAINGKIYLGESSASSPFPIEEYDPVDDKWRVVDYAPPRRHGKIGVGAAGVFYIVCSEPAGVMDAYDVCAGKWLGGMPGPLPLPGRGRVVGACGTPAGHVYIIVVASEAELELSFWRWEGKKGGGEWTRLVAPSVPERRRLFCKQVRFSCVAVGDETVVAILNVSPNGGSGGGWIGRDVLVYNAAEGMWSQGPQLPIELYSAPALAFTHY